VFAVGERVTWTHTSACGGGFNFSTRSGKIEQLTATHASVKMGNNRRKMVPLCRLRKEGQRTELTEMFLGKDDSANSD
jgi:hypothetical protein